MDIWRPCRTRSPPAFKEKPWPPQDLSVRPVHLAHLLRQLLLIEPSERLTAQGAIAHALFELAQLAIQCAQAPAGRGLVSFAQGDTDVHTLRWLQGDEYWPVVLDRLLHPAKRCKQAFGEDEARLGVKHEEAGYIPVVAPQCKVISTMIAKEELGATRVVQFARQFIQTNAAWLLELTLLVRAALCAIPDHLLGENGRQFMDHDLRDLAWVYGIIQVMKVGARLDPDHFDGGASLLHMGLTIFGERLLQLWFKDRPTEQHRQRPGSLYVGNMCAVLHQVVHTDVSDFTYANLYGDPGVHIVIMFRCDLFKGNRARKLGTGDDDKPTPVIVYDAVNEVVAAHIASKPLRIPDFAECVV